MVAARPQQHSTVSVNQHPHFSYRNMGYKEPAPIKDKDNPFESMMSRFHVAAEKLGLDEEIYNVLKTPDRQFIVSMPVTMDDGSLRRIESGRTNPTTTTLLSLSKALNVDMSELFKF